MKKALFFSLAVLSLAPFPARGHDMPDTRGRALKFAPGRAYEIRYTPIGTAEVTVVTLSGVGDVEMMGMREMLKGTTPEGESYFIPVDLILDIREMKAGKPEGAEAARPKNN